MDHPTMHDAGHNAVVEVVHFQSNALEQTQGQRITIQFFQFKFIYIASNRKNSWLKALYIVR